jgi:hypothetical protein
MRVIFSVRTAPPVAMRDKHTAAGAAGATATPTPLFLSVCSGHRSAPPLLKKLFWTTDNIVPATASSGKTVPASPPFFLVLQQGELTR